MKNISFIKMRKIFFIIAVSVIIIGIIGAAAFGREALSIDFKGGTVINIEIPNKEAYDKLSLKEAEKLVAEVTSKDVCASKFGFNYDISDDIGFVYKDTVILNIRIQTNTKLTETEINKINNYFIFSDNKYFENINIPEPNYDDSSKPGAFVAEFLGIRCPNISTDNKKEYDDIMEKIQNEIKGLLSGVDKEAKVSTAYSFIYKAGDDSKIVEKYMLSLKIVSTDKLLSTDTIAKIKSVIGDKYNIIITTDNYVGYNFKNVSPEFGLSILKTCVITTLVAALFVFLYMWFRFKTVSGLALGVMSVIVMIYNVLLMFLFSVMFGFGINEKFMAALIAVIGYMAINTVLVFDKIKELKGLDKKILINDVVDTSIKQTLKRGIISGSCVVGSLIVLLVFAIINGAAPVIEFTVPLMIGIISAFFTSVFVTPNLWILGKAGKKKNRRK